MAASSHSDQPYVIYLLFCYLKLCNGAASSCWIQVNDVALKSVSSHYEKVIVPLSRTLAQFNRLFIVQLI